MKITEILFWMVEISLITIGAWFLLQSQKEMMLIITLIMLITISTILILKYSYNLDYYKNIRLLRQKYEIEKNNLEDEIK